MYPTSLIFALTLAAGVVIKTAEDPSPPTAEEICATLLHPTEEDRRACIGVVEQHFLGERTRDRIIKKHMDDVLKLRKEREKRRKQGEKLHKGLA